MGLRVDQLDPLCNQPPSGPFLVRTARDRECVFFDRHKFRKKSGKMWVCCVKECNAKVVMNTDCSAVLEFRGVHSCQPMSAEKIERMFLRLRLMTQRQL